MKSPTYADKFYENYCVRADQKRCAYLVVPVKLKPEVEPSRLAMFETKAKNINIDHVNHRVDVKVHIRFINALKKCENNVPRIFILLNQILNKSAIKALFPEVYAAYKKSMEKKSSPVKKKSDQIHRECVGLMRNTSIRAMARSSVF